MPKPMREVSKSTPKEGSDGPPSSNKSSMKAKKGHKQSGGKKVAEGDAYEQTKKNRQVTNADPFRELMAMASRNSRYALPMENMGVVDPGDPMAVSPDEHKNAPKTRRMS